MKTKPFSSVLSRSIATLAGCISATLLICPKTARAVDDFGWNLAGPADWNNAANWTNININAGNNDRFINNGGTAVITVNTNVVIRDTKVALGAGTSGTVNHLSGLHNIGGSWTFIGDGGTGTYNLANTAVAGGGVSGFATGSGSITTGRFRMGDGANSTARANVNTTGSITSNGGFFVGLSGGATSVSTLNVENGTITNTGELWVGNGSSIGTVNQTGGSVSTSDWEAKRDG